MNYSSYRSSPIRNLDTSQAAKQRFEDEFFQIRCTRLEKEKKQLEDEVNLLNTRLLDNLTKSEQILLLNTKITQLTEQNERLRLIVNDLSIGPTSRSLRSREIYQSRQNNQLEHRREVDDLMMLYETAKAQTAIFRNQNQRLRTIELRKSRESDVDDLGKAMEISKLKISLTTVEVENNKLKTELQLQQKQNQRLSKLYNYEKRAGQERQREHKLLLSQVKQTEIKDDRYFSVQETPIKTMMKDHDFNQAEEEISSLKKKLQQQNEIHQVLTNKYSDLINQHEQVTKERDELRATQQYTLREKENSIERSRNIESNKGQRVSNNQYERMKRQLKDKQEQIKSILIRFAPLLKIKEGEVSLEQDRKERINKHWKADLAILDVLLNKYKIQIF